MISPLLKYTLIFILVLMARISFGQNCTNYHIDNCRWADRTFLYSRQSKSAVFTPGMRSEFRIIVYGGEEYYMSVDGHRKLGDIRLRVFEDNKKKTLLYDNAEYDYEEYFFFRNTKTRDLTVEVTTEEADDPEEAEEEYCLGVLIEFKESQPESSDDKVGF
jgi:hypothetical protein